MEVIIGRKFIFEAAHRLPNNMIYGQCSNLHGHRYELFVEIKGIVNEDGWICNFKDIKSIVQDKIIDKFDHACLNDFLEIPTAENILLWIFDELKNLGKDKNYKLNKLELYETEKCYAKIVCD